MGDKYFLPNDAKRSQKPGLRLTRILQKVGQQRDLPVRAAGYEPSPKLGEPNYLIPSND